MNRSSKKLFLAGYVPVIHKGYINFFKKFKNVDTFFVFDNSLVKVEDYLRKDIRALDPKEAARLIKLSGYFDNVQLLNEKKIKELDTINDRFIFADDDVSNSVAGEYIKHADVEFYPVFLRWDRRNTEKFNQHDDEVKTTKNIKNVNFMKAALDLGARSSDIWRGIGAILVDQSNQIVNSSENRSEPTQFTPWLDGDTRAISRAGKDIEVNLFLHAEARLIAQAARSGLSLRGMTLYVTTFPCPACALLVGESGIKKLYYKDGYALLNGGEVLKQKDVEVIRVLMDDSKIADREGVWQKYPERKQK